jgi:4-carboxymuconolactone decarboxylase
MAKALPKTVNQFSKQYPKVWEAFNELGERCHQAGPLDEKTRRLIKLALSIGAGLEGATHSAVRGARKAGITADEINHVALLAITTLGFPAAARAMTWIADPQDK